MNVASKESPLLRLTRRLLGEHAEHLSFELFEPDGGMNGYEWNCDAGGKVVIRGGTLIDQACGFHHYLREACGACLTWEGDRVRLPPRRVAPGVRRGSSLFRYRHYLNQVAFSYSTPWWDWPRWEREIDWMALHGFNLPLMAVGQEAVWQDTWRALGLSDADLASYWTGPAYLPFHRMGCIDGYMGPLPVRWIERQAELAVKILERMRAYGMTPVLPAFAGHVPPALGRVFPEARIAQLEQWSGFEGTWYLDTADPLFGEIQQTFLRLQIERFGTDHVYSADPFIEVPPTTSNPAELAQLAAGLMQSMTAVDPEAKWVLQAWPFSYLPDFWSENQVQGFLEGLPVDRVLVLDLFCEVRELWRDYQAFHGRPWLWCTVENFGGRAGVIAHGRLDDVAGKPLAALQSPDRGQLTGMGLTCEAIEENSIEAALFADRSWTEDPIDLTQWLSHWLKRRYCADDPEVLAAWQILRETVYAAPQSVISPPFTLVCDLVEARDKPRWYPVPRLLEAGTLLLNAADQLCDSDLFRHDLVRVLLRGLLDIGDRHIQSLRSAVAAGEPELVRKWGQVVLNLIETADRLAATRQSLMLGPWIAAARAWGDTPAERDLLERNAKTLVTTWGGPILFDYACRPWAGLFVSFYHGRWSRYLDAAVKACSAGKPLDWDALKHDLAEWERQWIEQPSDLPTEPRGDELEMARLVHRTYFASVATLRESAENEP